jgi:hypothetical protein
MPSAARSLALALLVLACDAPPAAPTELSPANAPAHAAEFVAVQPDAPASTTAPAIPYDRKAWKHWIDEDHDCQDTRTEVLITEAYAHLELEGARECEVAAGEWQCPYTGNIIREVHLLDVDHMVPLANAHRSGGGAWTDERRREYANDLSTPNHLIAVEYAANRSKGDKGPEAWLPTSEDYRCTYVRDWKAIKAKWNLRMTEAEAAAVTSALRACDKGQFPALPQARAKPAKKAEPKSEVASEPAECCKVCKKGKACGDSCIAKESSCTKPTGCACDG